MFETKRLLLRCFDLETDEAVMLQWQNDADFRALNTHRPHTPKSREASREYMKPRSQDTLPLFAVCLKPATYPLQMQPNDDYFKACGPPIGMLNFQTAVFDLKNRTTSLGISIHDTEHRGKGYGRELLEWALDYAFSELGLHRVELTVYSFNEVAMKLYRKVGFVDEGRQRKTYFKGGQWYDTIMMAILEEEWFELRKQVKQ